MTPLEQVAASVAIIIIVALQLEDTQVQLDLSSLGLAAGAPPLAPHPPPLPRGSARHAPPALHSTDDVVDLNTTAGPLHVRATCLLHYHAGAAPANGGGFDVSGGTLDPGRSLCIYTYAVAGVSLAATGALACMMVSRVGQQRTLIFLIHV